MPASSSPRRTINLPAALKASIATIQRQPLHTWTVPFLEAKRTRTDAPADAVIAAIMSQHQGHLVNELFQQLTNNGDPIPQRMPDEVAIFFLKTDDLPPWANKDLMALGQRVYALHGHLMGLVLSCKSLPESYACAKGAKVLQLTGRLNEQSGAREAYTRRIVETAQFVVNVMLPGSMEPDGQAIRTIQKVRLIHATIRYYLHKNGWDTAQYGAPINQEDMAGTLMAFSVLVLDGLKLLHVVLSAEEEEAFMHCWRVAGYLMGVDADLLPNNVTDARNLGNAILSHQMAPSDAGRELTAALIKFKEEISPEGKLMGLVPEMIRFMVGPDIARMLGVKADPEELEKLQTRMWSLVDTVDGFVKSSPLLEDVASVFARLMLKGMIGFMGRDVRPNFYLPESLKRDWGVD
jgi:hypothetical protein